MELFFKFMLIFTDYKFLVPFVLFGLYTLQEKAFICAALMAFFAAFLNSYLKSIWQVPLNPELFSHGWAFPSGHTQMSITFWCTLIYMTRKYKALYFLIPIILVSLYSITYFKYHTWYDISAGIFFAVLTFIYFRFWKKMFKDRYLELATVNAILSIGLYFMLPETSYGYPWLFAYFAFHTAFILYLGMRRMGFKFIHPGFNTRNIITASLTAVCFWIMHISFSDIDPVVIYFKMLSSTLLALVFVPALVYSLHSAFDNRSQAKQEHA